MVASNVSQLERSVFEMLQGPDGTIRRAAVEVLGWIEGIVADAGIRDIGLNDPDIATRWAAQRSVSARRTAPARRPSADSETNTRLPSDFDIFSPSMQTMARRASSAGRTAAPVRASLWARLALVVREDQVAAAAVEVDRRAELAQAPAPSTRCAIPGGRAPTGLPGRLVVERGLPEHEVERVALVRVVRRRRHARAASSSISSRVKWLTWPKPLELGARRSRPRRPPGRRGPASSTIPMKPRMSGIAEVARGSE